MKHIKLYLAFIPGTLLTICACHNKVAETKTKAPFCLTDTLQRNAVIEEVKLQIVKKTPLLCLARLRPMKISGSKCIR